MSKHTPGPWHSYSKSIHVCYDAPRCQPLKRVIAMIECDGVAEAAMTAEQTANARLIAAAPELLQHLKYASMLLDRLRPTASETHREEALALLAGTQCDIEAIIRKAEGTVTRT